MDMYELDAQVDNELFEERVKFVKSILKEKCLEMEALTKKIDALTERLDEAEEDYNNLLTMTVDDVYDKYAPTTFSCTCSSTDAKVILEFDYNIAKTSTCEYQGSFIKIDTPIISTRKY